MISVSMRIFSRALIFTSIFISSVSVFGMESANNNNNNNTSAPGNAPNRSQGAYITPRSLNHDNQEFGKINGGFNKRLFKESIKCAPERIRDLINYSLDPRQNKSTSRIIALVGPTGSGKSTLAKAIASKMNRKYFFVSALSLLGSHLHKGVENVRALFNTLRKLKDKPMLILDEANYLADDHIKDNSDAKSTASTLWSEIDIELENDDFTLIVTGNDFSKMPTPLQDRIISTDIYEIAYIPLTVERLKFFLAEHPLYSQASNANDDFLKNFAEQAQILPVRAVKAMVGLAIRMAWKKNSRQVTREDFQDALALVISNRERFGNFGPQESNEDKRLRLTMEQNQRIADRAHRLAQIQLEHQNHIEIIRAAQKAKDDRITMANQLLPGFGCLLKDLDKDISYAEALEILHQDMLEKIAALDAPATPQALSNNNNNNNNNAPAAAQQNIPTNSTANTKSNESSCIIL